MDKTLEYLRLLDALCEFIGESEDQSPEEIREELRKDGFNFDSIEKELIEFQQKISKKAKNQC